MTCSGVLSASRASSPIVASISARLASIWLRRTKVLSTACCPLKPRHSPSLPSSTKRCAGLTSKEPTSGVAMSPRPSALAAASPSERATGSCPLSRPSLSTPPPAASTRRRSLGSAATCVLATATALPVPSPIGSLAHAKACAAPRLAT